jgi:hypothetical protein
MLDGPRQTGNSSLGSAEFSLLTIVRCQQHSEIKEHQSGTGMGMGSTRDMSSDDAIQKTSQSVSQSVGKASKTAPNEQP